MSPRPSAKWTYILITNPNGPKSTRGWASHRNKEGISANLAEDIGLSSQADPPGVLFG